MASKFRAPRRRSAVELFLLLFLLLVVGYIFYPSTERSYRKRQSSEHVQSKSPANPLPCYSLPGAEDTVVMIKTSAAELENKLPIHFNTTFQCYPNYLIFSDYQEEYKGYHIIDALEHTSRRLREKNADFELWRRLHKGGPDVLDDEEVWKADNTAKDIDKWKWLPMLDRTFHEFPDKKWYVFLETDTFIFWHNMLQWLSLMDHTKRYYLGAFDRQAAMMNLVHGDAGVIFSHAAMEAMLVLIRADQAGWDERTEHHPRGASILAEAVVDAQIPLTESWPIMQDYRLANMDYTSTARGRRLWCHPTVSYGSISQPNIAEMWKFEQEWIRDHPGQIIRHKDVFNHFILPRLVARSGRVDDWDNFSDEEGAATQYVAECQDHCVKRPGCVQYSLVNGRCRYSSVPKMGEHKRAVESRWLLSRAQQFADTIDHCTGDESWIIA